MRIRGIAVARLRIDPQDFAAEGIDELGAERTDPFFLGDDAICERLIRVGIRRASVVEEDVTGTVPGAGQKGAVLAKLEGARAVGGVEDGNAGAFGFADEHGAAPGEHGGETGRGVGLVAGDPGDRGLEVFVGDGIVGRGAES